MQSYTITSLNIPTLTVTATLVVDSYKLQEDIPVSDFQNVDAIRADILKHLSKLNTDSIKSPKQLPISQELQDMVGQEVVVK